jgi:hypothetical protein
LADPERSREMARNGAEKMRASYSLPSIVSNVKRLYEELIEEKQCVT